jgi:hypothetical protein
MWDPCPTSIVADGFSMRRCGPASSLRGARSHGCRDGSFRHDKSVIWIGLKSEEKARRQLES